MGDPYERVKGGRLSFKGGGLACLSKSIDKKKNKKKNKKNKERDEASEFLPEEEEAAAAAAAGGDGDDGGSVSVKTKATATAGGGDGEGEISYTIDAAKRMKYDQLFPVEARKFGYDPKSNNISKSVEDALDDRVKKKADRYCK